MTHTKQQSHDKYMMYAVMPLILCGWVLYGARVLLLNLVAMVTARAVDVLVSMVRKTEFDSRDNSSVLAAIIFCLMLPVNVPLYVVIVPVVLTILVGKHLFGGSGVYPFNLSALAMCCAAVNWPEAVFSAVVPFTKVELLSGYAANATVSNATILKNGGVPLYDAAQLLLGNYPASMGADFVIVIIALGVFLLLKKRITWHIPVTFLLTCAAIAFAFPRVYGFSRLDSISIEMLTGSVFFVALFMLSEPTTTPKTPKAKIIFGVLAGLLGMMFRYFGSFEIGTCFALLIVNTLDGYIDRMVAVEGRIRLEIPQVKTVQERKAEREEKLLKEKEEKRLKEAAKAEKSRREKEQKIVRETQKTVKKMERKTEKAAKTAKPDTMGLISEAEDNLDDVIYSTRTLKIEEILRMEEELKKQKEAENNEK